MYKINLSTLNNLEVKIGFWFYSLKLKSFINYHNSFCKYPIYETSSIM